MMMLFISLMHQWAISHIGRFLVNRAGIPALVLGQIVPHIIHVDGGEIRRDCSRLGMTMGGLARSGRTEKHNEILVLAGEDPSTRIQRLTHGLVVDALTSGRKMRIDG